MALRARTRKALSTRSHPTSANRDVLRGRHRDGIMRTAARHRPLRAREQRGGRLISKRRFRIKDCFGTMKHRPIFRAGQNKTPNWRWWQSGRTCGAPQTGSSSTRKHRQSHNQTTQTALPTVLPAVRPADRTEWPNQRFRRTSRCHAEIFSY